MAVKDKQVDKDAKFAKECLLLEFGATAISQTDLEKDALVPGFPFEIVRAELYAKTVTATISANLRIGATSVLTGAVTPVADTPTAGTLVTSAAGRRGTSTSEINAIYTSNGSGAATNLRWRVWIRPVAMNGEAGL